MKYCRTMLAIILISLCFIPEAEAEEAKDSVATQERESIFPGSTKSLATSHFTWGAELGASIDLAGNDLSTMDVEAILGYKNSWLRILGVGAGVRRAFGNGNTFIPVYAVFRSSFRSKPSVAFLSLKAGYSFNTIHDYNTEGGFTMSLGIGFNLAMSKRFQSHIVLGVGFMQLSDGQRVAANVDVKHLDLAQISFGVNF